MNTQSDRDLLIEVATIVRKMDERLFGGAGHVGDIDRINSDVRGLQSYKNKLIGAIGVVTFLVLAFGGVLVAHLLK